MAADVRAAARALSVSDATLRRWVREGAPVARRGGRGRGRTTLVDIAAVSAWRRGGSADYPQIIAGEVSEIVATALYEAFVATDGPHKRMVAGVLAGAWYLTTTALLDRLRADDPEIAELRAIPEKIVTLRTIFGSFEKLEV